MTTEPLPNDLAFSVAETCRKWSYTAYTADSDVTEPPRNLNVERQYETRLDRAINDTQTKIQSQRRALEELRKKLQDEEEKQQATVQNMNPEAKRLHDLSTQLLKIQSMTKAQNYLLHMVSQIPPSESPLNTLLTRENAETINEQTSETIKEVKEYIGDYKGRISKEQMALEELMEIQDALKERLASLRTKSQQTSAQYLAERSHQKTAYTTSTQNLTKGVQQFIKNHLSGILLAESQGALPGEPKSVPKSKRKRDQEEEDTDAAERELAGRMIALVEELMNRLVSPDIGSQWVTVAEDDVIVRCLVRSNIATMHPNDGSKIRLVEFHKEIESDEMKED